MFSAAAAVRRDPPDYGNDFVFSVRTVIANDTFSLLLSQYGTYDFTVNWGDGTTDNITAITQPEVTHIYASARSYVIRITGLLTHFSTIANGITENFIKIIALHQLGVVGWEEFRLDGCVNIEKITVGNTDTTAITNVNTMFSNCGKNVPGVVIDVRGLSFAGVVAGTAMIRIFSGCSTAIDIIGIGDVPFVQNGTKTSYAEMFSGCRALTSLDLSGWDTTYWTSIQGLFRDCNVLVDVDVSHFKLDSLLRITELNDLALNAPWNVQQYSDALVGFAETAPFDALASPDFFPGGAPHPLNYYAYAASARSELISRGLVISDSGEIPNP